MTTWIFGISAQDPEHWEIAKQQGLWDMTKAWDVQPDDHIYFWQSHLPKSSAFKDRLVGLVRATSSWRELKPADYPLPWNKTDKNLNNYKYRFDLEVVNPRSSSDASWTEIERRTGVTGNTRFGPQRVIRADGARWLRWQLDIGQDEILSGSLEEALDEFDAGEDLPDEDRRRKVNASIYVREGRGPFRDALVQAYEAKCAITGVSAPVLDAAHIRPYQGRHSNDPSNGILLRTDLHTLFDRHLLTVMYEANRYVVRVAEYVEDDLYRDLDGQELAVVPNNARSRPSTSLLAEHNDECRKKWKC
ncbi:HNH endonuclease [Janibacter corallicola]|uniref:HNH endonuclease n=1 Tax=Janibacter corallicola TaxID=415212 RepID=UPI00083165AA|nr:HNH endonuclease [Janibacter corallicola]